MTASPSLSGTAVILGAGPAGLAAGLALSRVGWSVEVFEQASIVGGLARTVCRDGFRFDIGGHRWFTKKDELNHFLMDLLGDELLLVDRSSKIYYGGKYVDYPLRAANVLSNVGPRKSARAIGDFAISQVQQNLAKKPIVSMRDAYVAQFGQTLYELFFARYSEKVWGKKCSELSGDWVTQRSRGLSLFTAMRGALSRRNGHLESLAERFMYPRMGYGRISERMASEIEKASGRVHLGQRVTQVRHDGRTITGVHLSDGRHEKLVEGDAFVSSIPMTELAAILSPRADPPTLAAAEALQYRALMTVHLMIDRPRVTDDTWIYLNDPRISFARLHEPRNWSPAMAPEGKTSLVLELFCEADDATWQMSDADVCAWAERELVEKLRFIEPGEVIDGFVERSRDAYPRYSLDYGQAVQTIKRHLRSFNNLSIVGRGGTFRYNNADHAIETGLLAAARILGEAVHVDRVNSEPEYLEERRVPMGASTG